MIGWIELFRRLLPWLGLAAIPLAGLLVAQMVDGHHWHSEAGRFEKLYISEQNFHKQTIINYQNAANQARANDLANKQRVEAEQKAINQKRDEAYEARIADARARADRLRHELEAAAHPGGSGKSPVSGLPGSSAGPGSSAPKDGLPLDDRLIATEQAIQLDELIKWVKGIAGIDTEGNKPK